MSESKAVLLIPEEGDPHKLLGDPESAAWKCGARPPIAWRRHCSEHGVGRWSKAKLACGECVAMVLDSWRPTAKFDKHDEGALVLAVDGEPVAEGLIQLRKVGLENISTIPAIDWPDGTVRLPAWVYSFDHLVKWSGRFAQWGTVIRIDAEWREVSDE